MNSISSPKNIHIAESKIVPGERGVFASEDISAGTCIEKCPVTTLEPNARNHLRKTGLVNYYFLWHEEAEKTKKAQVSICFGYGSIYNHSFEPNARYIHNPDKNRMDFYALRDIKAGEEIAVNYNGDPSDTRKLNIPGIPGSAAESKAVPLYSKIFRGIHRRINLAASWLGMQMMLTALFQQPELALLL